MVYSFYIQMIFPDLYLNDNCIWFWIFLVACCIPDFSKGTGKAKKVMKIDT